MQGGDRSRGGSFLRQSCISSTDYPDICISTLEADRRSIGVNDLTRLCRVAMEVAEAQIKYTSSFLYQFLGNETDTGTQFLIKHCVRFYTAAIKLIDVNALPAFDAKNYNGAYDSIDQARITVAECSYPRLTKIFQGRDSQLIQFVSDVRDLVDTQRSVSR